MACVKSKVTDLSWRPGCRRFSSMTHERVKRVRSFSRFPVPSFSSMMFRLLILGPSSVLCESGIMPRGGRGRKKKYRVVTKRWNVPLPADAAVRRRERSRPCGSVRTQRRKLDPWLCSCPKQCASPCSTSVQTMALDAQGGNSESPLTPAVPKVESDLSRRHPR